MSEQPAGAVTGARVLPVEPPVTTIPLDFLRATLDAAERAALATTPVPISGEWAAVRDKDDERSAPLALIQGRYEDDFDYEPGYGPDPADYNYGVPVIVLSAEWQDEAEANLRFIAANSPAATLRRIAADRKLIADCERTLGGDDFAATLLAKSAIFNLAEGWGWTEEAT